MFTKSAQYYDALYHFKDYTAASRELHAFLRQLHPGARTLLDVACGTGKHLECLREYYEVQGLDLNPELLEIARRRCPDVMFHHGNMVDFALSGAFDVVTCLFSSIGYVKSVENLERAIATMARHMRPSGIMIVEPWFSPDSYWTHRLTANFVDEPERKIAWMYTSELEGNVSVLNINYLVGTPEGIRFFTERHEIGLFTHEEYLSAFHNAKLDVSYDSKGFFGRGMYLGVN